MRRYGWIADLPDARDRMFRAPRKAALPRSVDLRATCPKIYDQGDLGSCTANALAAAIELGFKVLACPSTGNLANAVAAAAARDRKSVV